MKTLNRISLAALFSIALSSIATAGEPGIPLPRPTFAAGYTAPYAGGYGYLRTGAAASTAHESFLRGRADVIRATGEYKLLVAEALRSYEEARSRRLDNDVKELATRQERRRMWYAEQQVRHDQLQSRREMTMALNRAAREAKMHVVPTEQLTESRAQSKLQLAKNLLNNGRYESGINGLVEITQQFAHTAAAQEAAGILTEIQG